ncbi:MAG: 4Fe-4S dicluster domain-containing protein [Rhodopirellula sp.]|nr:4Fe-4S dicluster domain-containing protein [Rhodopirellula sp.]
MSTRVDPDLSREVAKFGAEDTQQCIHCGNCTAVCSLAGPDAVFPRKIIRYAQLGLRDKLLSSTEPWLCYYCGECSQTCPRQANPGEIMMSVRRWLTAQYDWTGFAERLYLSTRWEIAALTVVAALVVAAFLLFHGPIVTDRVELNTFAPVFWVELGDWLLAVTLGSLLLVNSFRMVRLTLQSDRDRTIPTYVYLAELRTLVVHFLTQKRWRNCESLTRWWKHAMLVSGYLTMMLLVIVLLRWFQTDGSEWRIIDLLGYYATGVLLYFTIDAILGRLRRGEEIHKHSHVSDWTFLVLLLLTSSTGILVHLFRLAGLAMPTYATYVVHLAVAIPMLVVEVPFGKWSHLAYRPLALYLIAVKHRAEQVALPVPSSDLHQRVPI